MRYLFGKKQQRHPSEQQATMLAMRMAAALTVSRAIGTSEV